jgi:transposase
MEQTTRFVGLDIHKATIVAAVISSGERGKAVVLGEFPNTPAALEKLVKRLRAAGGGVLKFCYEAGPCGYGVHRTLTRLGEDCVVVAPSMIPRRPGDRQKNDQRDAMSLAALHKGGLLTAVWVPDAAHEAMRDLIRARLAAVRAVRTARQQLSAFLLRHERVFPDGRTPWTQAHRRWLAEQRFDQPAQQIVLEECIEAVRLAEQRRDRGEAHLRAQIPCWSLAPLVRDLCALRGLDVIGAAGLAAAIGDPSRFPSARDFMAYLGLVPSEHSSGPRQRLGAITKSGDVHARTVLIEAAWSYRFPARVARAKLAAVEAAPDAVREIAWKAQIRLCRRYRLMMDSGKPKQVVVTAIARELAGFVWAVARRTAAVPTHAHHPATAAEAAVGKEVLTVRATDAAGAERSPPPKLTPLRAGRIRQRTKRLVKEDQFGRTVSGSHPMPG